MKRTLPVFGGLLLLITGAFGQNDGASVDSQRALVNEYCAGCHNDRVKSGDFSWMALDLAQPEQNAEKAEKVIRKVRSGMMPPAGAPRPNAATLKAFASGLERRLDQAAAKQPYITAPSLHRLNRTEYRNSIRDVLDIDVDVTEFLPPDAKAGSFDNQAEALTISPALMQAYIRSAEKISRLAVGDPKAAAAMVSYGVPKVANQMRHIEGTPFGTRGGMSVVHNFPADGDYVFKADLYHSVTGGAFGGSLAEQIKDQELDISIDGERVAVFKIDPGVQEAESNMVTNPIRVTAGPHRVAASFPSRFDGPIEDQYRLIDHTLLTVTIGNNPRMTVPPHLRTVYITGPTNPSGVSETASRKRIFTCRPSGASDEETCARSIITRLATNAFRRPVNAEDMESLMGFYADGRRKGDFETGIRLALQATLAKPEFLFRFEAVPARVGRGQTYPVSDLELASRLSYFLWSSVPDDQLVAAARRGNLKSPAELERQVRRMLADPRSSALTSNFAGQWLLLRTITEIDPDGSVFPVYTRNLGNSIKREMELLFDSIVREDRNIADLLTADYTFVDQTLAEFYGIPNVVGHRFQRVPVTDPNRLGLIGKAGFLKMTSLANRTSPVARGKYVLQVLIGSPPPNPPANVPPLKEVASNEKVVSVRERMEQHRNNPACSACHRIMDPIGIALENFDAVGRVRTTDGGIPIDSNSTMYDGTELKGPSGVRNAVLEHSESFVGNFTEQLFAYALGRVVDYRDLPTIRSIAREAAKTNNRFSGFVIAIVKNPAFQMTRNAESQ